MPPISPTGAVAAQNESFDQARSYLFTTIGATSDTINRDTIEALFQGGNAPVEKVILQTPGVSQDSTASGLSHIRNELVVASRHSFFQFRIGSKL